MRFASTLKREGKYRVGEPKNFEDIIPTYTYKYIKGNKKVYVTGIVQYNTYLLRTIQFLVTIKSIFDQTMFRLFF